MLPRRYRGFASTLTATSGGAGAIVCYMVRCPSQRLHFRASFANLTLLGQRCLHSCLPWCWMEIRLLCRSRNVRREHRGSLLLCVSRRSIFLRFPRLIILETGYTPVFKATKSLLQIIRESDLVGTGLLIGFAVPFLIGLNWCEEFFF